jgi:hypothetical protein
VGPVRVKVNVPLSELCSAAEASEAVTVTKGGSTCNAATGAAAMKSALLCTLLTVGPVGLDDATGASPIAKTAVMQTAITYRVLKI